MLKGVSIYKHSNSIMFKVSMSRNFVFYIFWLIAVFQINLGIFHAERSIDIQTQQQHYV